MTVPLIGVAGLLAGVLIGMLLIPQRPALYCRRCGITVDRSVTGQPRHGGTA